MSYPRRQRLVRLTESANRRGRRDYQPPRDGVMASPGAGLTSAFRKPLIRSSSSQLTSRSCPSSSSASFRSTRSIQYEMTFCASQLGALLRNLLTLPYIMCDGSASIVPIWPASSATMDGAVVSRPTFWTVSQTSPTRRYNGPFSGYEETCRAACQYPSHRLCISFIP